MVIRVGDVEKETNLVWGDSIRFGKLTRSRLSWLPSPSWARFSKQWSPWTQKKIVSGCHSSGFGHQTPVAGGGGLSPSNWLAVAWCCTLVSHMHRNWFMIIKLMYHSRTNSPMWWKMKKGEMKWKITGHYSGRAAHMPSVFFSFVSFLLHHKLK